jgi:methionine aminotransferase
MDSKLPDTGTTIFAVMSALSEECNAINLSQGFPSFDPDQELLDLVTRYLNNGANQYAPMLGVPSLRDAIASKVGMLYGRKVDADVEVTVCDGATEGLFSAIQAAVRPGDEVIVFDPAYDSYEPAVTLAGGTCKHIPLVVSDEQFSAQPDRRYPDRGRFEHVGKCGSRYICVPALG